MSGEASSTDLATLVAEREINRLLMRYVALNDAGRMDELSALFAQDGVLVRPTAPDAPIRGRDAILASFRARAPRKARHLVCNVEIEVEGPTSARATSTTVLISALPEGGTATSVGGFEDRLVKVGATWLFASRTGTTSI